MATLHFALDALGGSFTLTAGYGRIVGMATKLQGLRDQGFSAATYNGNKVTTYDTASAGWDSSCEPGWYLTPTGLQIIEPATQAEMDLAATKRELHLTLDQFDDWHSGLGRLAGGHPARAHQDGCDYLLRGRNALYVVARNEVASTVPATTTNPTYTHAERQAFFQSMRMGATDVNSERAFYQAFDAGLLAGATVDTDTGLITYPSPPDVRVLSVWARPNDAVRLALANSIIIISRNDPPVPASVEIGERDWVEALTS